MTFDEEHERVIDSPSPTSVPASHASPAGTPSTSSLQVSDGVDMDRLTGAPHLFARLKPLRDGYLFEPISSMTLQPDGRITGYGHPNEGSWIAY